MSYILIGGTFDGLHKGHREFIRKAFELGDRVLLCLTSDEMAGRKPGSEKAESYVKRKNKVEGFLREHDWLKRAEIIKIEDPFSEGMRPQLTYIVVSKETRKNAEKINNMREKSGLKPLGIIEMKWILADDGKPISDSRIRNGEIDENGKIM